MKEREGRERERENKTTREKEREREWLASASEVVRTRTPKPEFRADVRARSVSDLWKVARQKGLSPDGSVPAVVPRATPPRSASYSCRRGLWSGTRDSMMNDVSSLSSYSSSSSFTELLAARKVRPQEYVRRLTHDPAFSEEAAVKKKAFMDAVVAGLFSPADITEPKQLFAQPFFYVPRYVSRYPAAHPTGSDVVCLLPHPYQKSGWIQLFLGLGALRTTGTLLLVYQGSARTTSVLVGLSCAIPAHPPRLPCCFS